MCHSGNILTAHHSDRSNIEHFLVWKDNEFFSEFLQGTFDFDFRISISKLHIVHNILKYMTNFPKFSFVF